MKIAVLGAGIGGLAVSTLLARDGHGVDVFDRFECPQPVGSGLMLQETGLAVLDAMGLRQAAATRGAVIERLVGKSVPSGRTVLNVRFGALRADLHAVAIQRSALFDLLYATALGAGADFTGGVAIASAEPGAGSFTTLGGRIHRGFDLVINALGAQSPLSPEPRSELPFGALWATVPWPLHGGFDPSALEQRYRAARQMTGLMPSGRPSDGAGATATYFWSIAGDGHARWKAGDIARWRDDAVALWPESEDVVSALDHETLTFARYRHRTVGKPVQQRLVHLGDSWHATSPQLGQGANMALLDAYGLAVALRDGRDLGRALGRYASLRQSHVRLYQTMSYLFTPVYQSSGHVLPFLRDWVAAPLMGVPPIPLVLAALVSGGLLSPLKRLGLGPKPREQGAVQSADGL